ncbi:MAG: AMP-binding protein [Myxococcales bacterium]
MTLHNLPRTLPALLAVRAAATPDRLVYRFLRDADMQPLELSFADLYQRASDVAHALRARTAKGARVLLLCPPGLDYLVSLWGCLISERVAVPSLPPHLHRSSARFELLLADTLAGAALVTRSLVEPLERDLRTYTSSSLDLIAVDALEAAGFASRELLFADAQARHVALLQYTSGSSAAPRGVMLSHDNLLENCMRGVEATGMSPESQVVSWLPPYHDMGLVATVLMPVVAGCPSTMMSPQAFLAEPSRWLDAFTRYRGTHGGAPDFAYALCSKRIDERHKRGLDLSCWSVAWNGAERVRAETLDAFCTAFEPVGFRRSALRPCYGLAEATLLVSFTDASGPTSFPASERELGRHHVARATTQEDTTLVVGCGSVIPGHHVMIVDPSSGREIEPAASAHDRSLVGEIWLHGPSVPNGYFQRGEETEQVFRARPSPDDGQDWLRTGDLGFVLAGQLYVTGRLKDLLIVRGRNLYPEDIEHTVQGAHPAARANCAAAFSVDFEGEERVCLIQEVELTQELDWEQVGRMLRAAVFAEHELILHDLWLVRPGTLPKTSSGKVQRSLAKRRYLDGEFETVLRQACALVAPARRSEHEALVTAECAALLGLTAVDPDEDLFRLGMESVLAMQLLARLERALSVHVPLAWLFEARSAARLSVMLEAAPAQLPAPPIEPQHADLFPLALPQERIWREHTLDAAASACHVAGALVLRGPCQETALRAALQALIARHAALRTRYRSSPGLLQRVLSAQELPLEVSEVASLELAEKQAAKLAREPFDLTRGAVAKCRLYRVDSQLRLLALVIHPIACDGGSLDLLFAELCALYRSELRRDEAQLPANEVSFPDYAHWQRTQPDGAPSSEAALRYWCTQLAGAPLLSTFPSDGPRPAQRSLEGGLVTRTLPSTVVTALDAFCLEFGVTRFMALLSAFDVLLMRSSGETDLCVGTKVSGREHVQTERMVGPFANTLVMRSQVAPEASFAELVQSVKANVLEALEHRSVPFEHVVEALAPALSHAHAPLFQTHFDYQVMRRLKPHVDALEVEPLLLDRAASPHEVSLSLLDTGTQTQVRLEYQSDSMSLTSAERLAERFIVLLESALLEPHARCGKLPWLLPLEQEELLSQGRGPARAQGGSELFLDVFESRVGAHPDRTAVLAGQETVSYRMLDVRANQLAHRLRTLGVAPEVQVAVFLERGVELVVALLAVMKAGGAYVPLDPSYPPARIGLMLEDASPRVVITEQALRGSLPACEAAVLVLESALPHTTAMPTDPPPRGGLQPHHLAYLIFTSGSTGRPKGVENPAVGVVQPAERHGPPSGTRRTRSPARLDHGVFRHRRARALLAAVRGRPARDRPAPALR